MTKKRSRQELLDEVNKNDQLKKTAMDSSEAVANFKKALRDPYAYKKQLRIAKEQEKQARFAEQDALSQKDWDEMIKAAHELLHTGQQGYDSWVSAMSSVVQSAERRNKALCSMSNLRVLTNDVPSLLLDLTIFATSSAVAGTLGGLVNLGAKIGKMEGVEWRDLQPMIANQLTESVNKFRTLGEDTLPGVRYCVEFDANNKMVIKDLVRLNFKSQMNPSNIKDTVRTMAHGNSELEFNRTEILAFQAMVVAFLEEKHNCVPDKENPGQFQRDGKTLSQHTLNGYLDDAMGGDLRSYLKSKLSFTTPGSVLDDSIDIEPLPSLKR